MDKNDVEKDVVIKPFLCFGSFFSFLLEHTVEGFGKTNKKDDKNCKNYTTAFIALNQIVFKDFNGKYMTSDKVNKWKFCAVAASNIEIPISHCAKTFVDEEWKNYYNDVTKRMKTFIDDYIHTDEVQRRKLVNQLISLIKVAANVNSDTEFYIKDKDTPTKKAEILCLKEIDLATFLLGIFRFTIDTTKGNDIENKKGKAFMDNRWVADGPKHSKRPFRDDKNIKKPDGYKFIDRPINVIYKPINATDSDHTPSNNEVEKESDIAINPNMYVIASSFRYYENLESFFVETTAYSNILSALVDYPIVLVIGNPGTGKTITSTKIGHNYLNKGFKVYYSNNGIDIDKIDKFLWENSNEPTLIILNDFLARVSCDPDKWNPEFSDGQVINAFVSLVQRVLHHKNVKLLINTRRIVYQNALSKSREFRDAIKEHSQCIMVDSFNLEERAWIFIKHLERAFQKNFLSKEQFLSIIQDRKYLYILRDQAFNPYLINVATRKDKINIDILSSLKNPEEVWKEEFEALSECDHFCMYALFSLTTTSTPWVKWESLEACFNSMIESKYDRYAFKDSIERLNGSFVKIYKWDNEESMRISMADPSVNDFVREYLFDRKNLIPGIIKSALYYNQLERFKDFKCAKEEYKQHYKSFSKLLVFPKYDSSEIAIAEAAKITTDQIVEGEYDPPEYMLRLRFLLLFLEESDFEDFFKVKNFIVKNFIVNRLLYFFENAFSIIKYDSLEYYSHEMSEIYDNLFDLRRGFDLSKIVYNEDFLEVILQSLVKHKNFWERVNDIQVGYFPSEKEPFYNRNIVKEAVVDKILLEIKDTISKTIGNTMKESKNYLDYEEEFIFEDIYDIIIAEGIEYDISNAIASKLKEHTIEFLKVDDFAFDEIFNLREIIEEKYNLTVLPPNENEQMESRVIDMFEAESNWI